MSMVFCMKAIASGLCHSRTCLAIRELHTSLELMRTSDEKENAEEAEYAGSHST